MLNCYQLVTFSKPLPWSGKSNVCLFGTTSNRIVNTWESSTPTCSQQKTMAKNVSEEEKAYFYLMFSMYTIQGAIVGSINLIVGLSILKHEALRLQNQYLFICGQCFADCLSMIAYATAGIEWSMLMSNGIFFSKRTIGECFFKPYRIFWGFFGDKLITLMQLMFAIDRLISVTYPLEHMAFSRKYALAMIGGAYAYSVGFGVWSIPGTYQKRNVRVSALCTTEVPRTISWWYGWWYGVHTQVFSVLSMLVFGVIVYKRRTAVVAAVDGNNIADKEKERKLEGQRRLTKSLLINAGTNLVFYNLPLTVAMMCDSFGCGREAKFAFVAANTFHLADIIIYSKRHKEIRQGLISMFTCKQMPSDLELWDKPKPKARNPNQGSNKQNRV